jgi:hypothetical protein
MGHLDAYLGNLDNSKFAKRAGSRTRGDAEKETVGVQGFKLRVMKSRITVLNFHPVFILSNQLLEAILDFEFWIMD